MAVAAASPVTSLDPSVVTATVTATATGTGTVTVTSAVAVAVENFLQAAVNLCCVVWDIHHDDPALSVGPELGERCLLLTVAVSSLLNVSVTSSERHVASCSVVARDILIRLARLDAATPRAVLNHQQRVIDKDTVKSIWSLHDIETLVTRVSQLAQEWEDLPINSHASGISKLCQSLEKIAVEQVGNLPSSNGLNDKANARAVLKRLETSSHVPLELLNEFILDSLAYKSMHNREEEVTRAHANTLEWLFKPSTSSTSIAATLSKRFNTWLTTDSLGPVFWITGKPGSGKSTFMSFLAEHKQTMQKLEGWADNMPIITAGFFFWTSGTKEQRSQTGLLRYLLHQMLTSHPELMPQTFPLLWEKLCKMSTKDRIKFIIDWEVTELMDAFHAFMDTALPEMKVCLFVDGLDEFEGDHTSIIQFFQSLSRRNEGKALKLCLSSRPWEVFASAFEHAVPNIRLQDVTYQDMQQYAGDRLKDTPEMLLLLDEKKISRDKLVDIIVDRADGVFLWVRLALNELIKLLHRSNDNLEPEQIIAGFPADLYELFEKLIFQDQAASEIAETSVLFQLIMAREVVADFMKSEESGSLTVWELTFALDNNPMPGAVKRVPLNVVEDWCNHTLYVLRTRFAGLMEAFQKQDRGNLDTEQSQGQKARQLAHSRVTYIHRTVRDWFMYEPGVEQRVLGHSPTNFDAHLSLLKAQVLDLKHSLNPVHKHRWFDDYWPGVSLSMTHARYIANDPGHLQRTLLNEMNDTISSLWDTKTSDPYDHWARNAFGPYESRAKTAPVWQPFLGLATKFGLTKYVSEEVAARRLLEPLELETDHSVPLLAYATEYLCSRNKSIYPLSSLELVRTLIAQECRISRGANHEYTEFWTRKPTTTWLMVLRHLRDARRRGWIEYYDVDPQGMERWTSIVALLLEEGHANPDAVVLTDKWDPEVDATGVLRMLDETYGDYRISDLQALLESKEEGGLTLSV